MPKEKLVYICSHPFCHHRNKKVFWNREMCERHENACVNAFSKKACPTCRWEDWYEERCDGVWYGMMNHRCGHPESDDNFGDDCTDMPDCPHWEEKTAKEWRMLELRLKDPHGQLPYGYK